MGHPCSGRRQIERLIYLIQKMTKTASQKRRARLARKTQSVGNGGKAPLVTRVAQGIPSHYPKAMGDTFSMPFKFTSLLETTGGASVTKLLVLGNGTSTGGYIFLTDVCAPFLAGTQFTTRWMITDLNVEVRATGVGGNANTFIAASYIPSNSGLDNVPLGLAEVSNSVHYAQSSLGTVGKFHVRPTEYFNDWRQVTDPNDGSDSQCGLIQLYGSGGGGSGVATAGVYTVSGVFHFCGLRV